MKNTLFLLLLISSITLKAQKDFIGVNSMAIPPFSNRIDELISNTNITSFLLNKTNQSLSVKMFMSIKKDGNIVVRTSNNYAIANPLNFAPNENKLIDFSQFGALKESDIDILPEAEKLGISRLDLIRSRKLPEGNYEICISIFDFTGQDQEQWNLPDIGCARMELSSYEVPQIIDVNGKNCGEKIQATNPQFVSISWLKPAGFVGLLDYEIDVVEVFPNNREFNDAIFTSTRPNFLNETTNSNIFVINLIHLPLKQGARYVFRVKAIDPNGGVTFRNNGFSQVCSFVYGDVPEEVSVANISSNLIYPALNDTVPFANVPMLLKWSPYFQNIENLKCQYTIKENQQTIREFIVDINCQAGLIQHLKTLNGGAEISENVATQIVLGKYGDSALNTLFERGKEYSIEIKSDFKYKNNPVVQSVNNQTVFTYGLPAAKLQLLNNMPDTGNLNFEIAFINKPEIPLGDFNQLDKIIKVFQFDSLLYINEKAFIEFSPQNSFDSIWYKKEVAFNKSFDITNPAVYLLSNTIYDNIPFAINIKETGNWFARIKWLKNTRDNSINPQSYYTSGALKFTLGDSVNRTATECLSGDCMFPPVAMNVRIPLDSLKTGMRLKIGHHNMLITSVNGSASTAPYSGEGVIKINPFPGLGGIDMPVKVKFTDIRFKADFRVFQGKAETVDGSGLFTNKNSALIAAQLADSSADKATLRTFIQNSANYVQNQINESVGMPMPIGFTDNKFAGTTYKIAIADILFTTENASMNIALGVNNATIGNYFDFVAQNVCLRSSGLSVAKLLFKSIGNKEIEIGNSLKLVILGASKPDELKSHVEWDCNGFKNFNLQGYVQISRDVLLHELKGEKIKQFSEDSSLMVLQNKYYRDSSLVQAAFNINIKSWNDFVVDLNIEKSFQIVGLPNWSFKATALTFDLSTHKNANAMVFPEGYLGLKTNEWQGVFLKQLEIKAPAGFKDKTNELARLKFNIQNLLVDRTGVSVLVKNNNLLPINKGRFGDWAVSVDLIEIKVLSNAFQYGKINGKLRVPLDSAKDFGYSMMIDYQNENNNSKLSYSTTVSTISQLDVPMWKAKFSVLPNSHAKFFYNSNDSFYAELKLNGKFSIKATLPKIKEIEFADISFQDMILRSSNSATTDSTYFHIGAISFASAQKKAGGFPVSFKNFKMVSKQTTFNGKNIRLKGLQIDLDISLKMGINTFKGATVMKLWARPDKKEGILGYKYHEFELDSVGVYGKIKVLEIEGGLKFYDNDPIYGNGLKGTLMAQFTPGIGLGATAYFGEVTQSNRKFDYWGVFGSVTLSAGIPILAAFEIAGFGGGAYNNMEMVLPASPPVNREVKLNSSSLIPILRPKWNIFGFRATVFAQSFPGGTSWKAALSLGAEIKKEDFSLQRINFQGNMWMMAPKEKPNETPKAAFWAGALLNYDFVTDQFDGNFTFYVNKSISREVSINGIQAADRAGTILLHYSSTKWFVYAGQPNDRCGLKLSSPSFSMSGYFVMGTQVPGIPALPEKIRNVINTPISPSRSSEISGGAGFGFGAQFDLNTGEKKFLFMTANLQLLVGFDMSLMQYENASCDGLSTSAIGIDGWYARGQLYAYVEGKINMDIDVWFYEGKVEIMDCKAGMVLEGGLPNPSWMKGTIAGNYRLFDGAIKGNFKFDAQIGKECRPAYLQQSPIAELKIIADVKPTNNASGYDIFDKPEILCNFELNKELSFEVVDNNGVKKTRTFRPKLNIRLKEGNTVISAYTQSVKIEETVNLTLNLNSGQAFKPFQQYSLELTEFFEEKINGSWVAAKNKDNQPVRSTQNIVFTTGGVPATIPENVITEMHPAIRENYFMKDIWSEGGTKFIKEFNARFTHNLKQYYFLDSIFASDRIIFLKKVKARYLARFTNVNNVSETFDREIRVDVSGSMISLQSGNLAALRNNTMYKIEIIRKPQAAASNNNMQSLLVVNHVFNAQYINKINNPNFKLETKTNTFKSDYRAMLKTNNEFVLFTSYFNVSNFNNLQEKVTETKILLNIERVDKSIAFSTKNSKNEPFDEREWNNQVWLKDMIRSGINWYKTWDSMKLCMDYLIDYQKITVAAGNINISIAATINADINSIKRGNTEFGFVGGYMWNLEPLNSSALVKNFTSNTEFLAANRSRSGQNFVSNFEKIVKADREIIDNNIIQVMALHNNGRASLRNLGVNNPATGPGKLMPSNVNSYLLKYLNGVYSSRKSENLEYHKLWWYYNRPYFDMLQHQINNYKIPSIINR